MPAPLRPIIPGDWAGLEQTIKDLWAILNEDTTLSDMVSDITVGNSDLKLVSDGLSSEVSDRQSAITYVSDSLSDTESEQKVISDALSALAVAGAIGGSDTEIQYNNGGIFGGAAAYWDDVNNRLGIGTTAPDRKLEINTGAATDGIRLSYNDVDGSAATYSEWTLDSAGDTKFNTKGDFIIFEGVAAVGGSTESMFLRFYSANTILFDSTSGLTNIRWDLDFKLSDGVAETFGTGNDFDLSYQDGTDEFRIIHPKFSTTSRWHYYGDDTLEFESPNPYQTYHNSTHEDTDGGGESRIIGNREDGAGTESTAGQIEISHGGAGANDTKGMMQLSVNNGTALTDVIEIDEDLNTKIGDAGTTNYAKIAADGELTLHGTGRVYACEIFESTDLSPGASGAAETILGNYIGYAYTINDDTILTFPLDKLEGYASGTDLTVKIRYYINEAYATANGETQWSAAWSACPSDASEAVDAPTHTGTIDSGDFNIPATAKTLKEETLGTIAGASLASEDEIGITLKRVALDGGNNPTAEPVVTCIGVVYTRDKLGVAL